MIGKETTTPFGTELGSLWSQFSAIIFPVSHQEVPGVDRMPNALLLQRSPDVLGLRFLGKLLDVFLETAGEANEIAFRVAQCVGDGLGDFALEAFLVLERVEPNFLLFEFFPKGAVRFFN